MRTRSVTNICFVVDLGDALQVGRKPELAAFNEMIGKFLIAGNATRWENYWGGLLASDADHAAGWAGDSVAPHERQNLLPDPAERFNLAP